MPAIGSYHPGSYSIRDYTGEMSNFRIFYDAVTGASIAGLLTQLGALTTALNAIILGVVAKSVFTIDENVVSNALPISTTAQREMKLLVQYQDATNEKPYTLTIPTIDPSILVFLPGAGDAVAFEAANGASAEIQAFVTAFEAVASPPDDPTHNVVVTGMRFVGRNS